MFRPGSMQVQKGRPKVDQRLVNVDFIGLNLNRFEELRFLSHTAGRNKPK